MTATPSSVLAGQLVRTAVLVTGRRGLPDARLSIGAPNCVVVRGRGRRSGAPEALVKELLEAGVTSLVVSGLAAIHPSPARAIGIVAALHSASVIVHSLTEPGIASADSATLSTIATFLLAAEQRRASKQSASVTSFARRTDKRVGRPPRPLPVSVAQARHLVELHGYRRAGALLGVSASSVRRATLVRKSDVEQMSNQGSSP